MLWLEGGTRVGPGWDRAPILAVVIGMADWLILNPIIELENNY